MSNKEAWTDTNASSNHDRIGMATVISSKSHSRIRTSTRYKEILWIKGSTHPDHLTMINIYYLTTGQKLTELKGKPDFSNW